MPMGLTQRQRDTLEFIASYQVSHGGLSPSFDEIMNGIALKGKSGVQRLVVGLQDRGYIRYLPNKARSITILQHPTFTLPPDTLARLYAFCRATRENPADIVADAVLLHLDELALEAAA